MGTCCKYKFKSTVRIKHIGARARHDLPIDRIEPIQLPVRPSKCLSSVLQAIDHSVAGSMTAQLPGFRPSALRVATHGQRVASMVEGSYPSTEVQSAYSTAPADRAVKRRKKRTLQNRRLRRCIKDYIKKSKEKSQ